MLGPLGVSEQDERVYRALLKRPAALVDVLAGDVRRDVPETGAALARLERLGLARREGGGDGAAATFHPVAPDAAVEELIRRRTAELDRLRLDAGELVAEFHAGALSRDPKGLVEIVFGEDEVLRRARALEGGATVEILSFDKPPFLVEGLPDHDEVGNERPLLGRGVAVRAVYTAEALAQPGRFRRVAELSRHGEEARVLPDLPLKLRVFDRRTAIVPLSIDVGVMSSVAVVHRSALLQALVSLFELHWAMATPFGAAALPDDDAQQPDEGALLAMLGAGLTDDAIARQLGVSARTVRRRIQRLLDRVRASTRFQAGAQAVRRGLLR